MLNYYSRNRNGTVSVYPMSLLIAVFKSLIIGSAGSDFIAPVSNNLIDSNGLDNLIDSNGIDNLIDSDGINNLVES